MMGVRFHWGIEKVVCDCGIRSFCFNALEKIGVLEVDG
jgi:hypothetical protein